MSDLISRSALPDIDLSYKGINTEKIKQIQRIRFPNHIPCTEQVRVDLKRTFSSDEFKIKDSVMDSIRMQIESYQNKYMEDYEMFVICEMAKLFLEEKPVVHGEWETVTNKVVEHGEVERRGTAERCSNCFHASPDFKKHMNFCPNCGADMRKEVNE